MSDLAAINTPYLSELDVTDLPAARSLPAGTLHEGAQQQLARMFRDPYVLSAHERAGLIDELRLSVAVPPEVTELRVLLGMALCVDLKVQDAMEILREAVRIDPDSFLAHLKLGELLMRLRICSQAVEETQQAAKLAASPIQSELARRQAATLRTMMREGAERGGLPLVPKWISKLWKGLGSQDEGSKVALIGHR